MQIDLLAMSKLSAEVILGALTILLFAQKLGFGEVTKKSVIQTPINKFVTIFHGIDKRRAQTLTTEPSPKWQVKVDQSSNLDRLPSRTMLAYEPVSFKILFFHCHFKMMPSERGSDK